MRDPEVIVRGSDRPNLFLSVQRVETEPDEIRALQRLFSPDDHAVSVDPVHAEADAAIFTGPGIVYTATTRAVSRAVRC